MKELRAFASDWRSTQAPHLRPLTEADSIAAWCKDVFKGDESELLELMLLAICEKFGCEGEDATAALMGDVESSWDFWARPDQWAPPGIWRTWLIMSGRGAGKTRTGAEWVHQQAITFPGCRMALVAETAADARDVMVQGESGIMSCSKPGCVPKYNPSLRRVVWPNGSSATTYSGDEPGQLRGPQHHVAWIDELAKYQYAKETWDNLQMGLRLGAFPRCLVTTTPRPIQVLKRIMASPATVLTRVSTFANRSNLPQSFFDSLEEQYAGTRIAAQELHGEIVEDVAGALWSFDMIEAARERKETPDLDLIAIGVDPSGSKEGDEVGIVAAGMADTHFFVLSDKSFNASAGEWGRAAVRLYDSIDADVIVVEKNFGGDMAEETLRNAARELWQKGEISSPDITVQTVTSTQKKAARAMPVAQMYEQGRVHHLGEFKVLEAEMRSFTAEWNRAKDKSPNRIDALVFAIRYLSDNAPGLHSPIFGVVNRGAFG